MTYAIIAIRSFYGPETRRELVQSTDHCAAARFATRADAQAYVDAMDSQRYYLAHNESDRPEYKIAKVDRLPAYLRYQL